MTRSVTLTTSHRCAPALRAGRHRASQAACRVAGGCEIDGTGDDSGSVTVKLAASADAEAALIADTLRRAHLVDGVPWSQMAVIVRSVPRAGAGLAHALARAGVPVASSAVTGSLAAQPAAQALLTVLAATADGLDGEQALTLLTGPIGRVDPVSLRQLRRTLRRADMDGSPTEFADLLVDAVSGASSARLTAAQARSLGRVRAVLAAAAESSPSRRGSALHALGGMAPFGSAASMAGGMRARRTVRRPGRPGPRRGDGVVRRDRAIPVAHRRRVAARAHRSSGRRSTCPRSAPSPRSRPSRSRCSARTRRSATSGTWSSSPACRKGCGPTLFRVAVCSATQRLLDVLDGVAENASMRAPLLAEERRLLVAAMGRARKRLLVTAIDGEAGDGTTRPACRRRSSPKSRSGPPKPPTPRRAGHAPRVLSAAAVVGRLRGVVCAPQGAVSDAMRGCAAKQLARLAAAGVAGRRPGRLVRHVAGQHHRTDVERGRSRGDADPVEPADVDRLPAALAGRAPRRDRSARSAAPRSVRCCMP